MASTLVYTQCRQQHRTKLQEMHSHTEKVCNETEIAMVAVEENCPTDLIEDVCEVRRASGALASVSRSNLQEGQMLEKKYGAELEELFKFKDKITFYAQYRDFISDFEDMVFRSAKMSAAYKTYIRNGGDQIASKQAALDLLADLERTKRTLQRHPHDAEAKAFLEEPNAAFEAVWAFGVKSKGLSMDTYKQLRHFKDASNHAFHQKLGVREALLQLQHKSAQFVPEELLVYKQPLIDLLRLLS